MSLPIQDYALIGDLHTAALVGRNGSIDWLCLPRCDSEACFAGLLGEDRHGHWRIAPPGGNSRVQRRYRPDTLVLETEFTVDSGTARLVDCMPPRESDPVLVRMIEGVSGTVDLRMTLAAAFEYGSAEPRVLRHAGAQRIVAGSETLWLFGPAHVRRARGSATAELTVSQGDKVPFAVVWRSSRDDPPDPPLVPALIDQTERWWRDWVAGLAYEGEWREAVIRSLITVKALTYAPTGGVVAAPTTSLPQQASGSRNWDYRYCWLRDAAATIRVLLRAGALGEAVGLLDWMSHAVAGKPSCVQELYGPAGERRLAEIEPGGAARLRRRPAGPDRQRGDRHPAARRLRRGAHRSAGDPDGRPERGARPLGRRRAARPPGGDVAPAGRRDLGGARPGAPVRALQGHGLGCRRRRCQDDRAVRRPRAGGPVAWAARRGQGRRARAWLRHPRRDVRSGL